MRKPFWIQEVRWRLGNGKPPKSEIRILSFHNSIHWPIHYNHFLELRSQPSPIQHASASRINRSKNRRIYAGVPDAYSVWWADFLMMFTWDVRNDRSGMQSINFPCPSHRSTPLYSERFADLEKKTGQPKAFFFGGATLLVFGFLSLLGGMKLISDLIGFLYPAYMSFKAIETTETVDDTQWLSYWVVFSMFSILESACGFLVEWIPFYFAIKILFFAWLFHPKSMGAAVVYKNVKWVWIFWGCGEWIVMLEICSMC